MQASSMRTMVCKILACEKVACEEVAHYAEARSSARPDSGPILYGAGPGTGNGGPAHSGLGQAGQGPGPTRAQKFGPSLAAGRSLRTELGSRCWSRLDKSVRDTVLKERGITMNL